MEIEFHSDPSTGAVLAKHASNGAILGTGHTEAQALEAVQQAVTDAWIKLTR